MLRDARRTPGARIVVLASAAWYVAAVFVVAWAVGYVAWPFSNDQGNLAWVGDVIRSGGMPYRDAWDVKGPAAHLLFMLAGGLGRNEWGLRAFDLVMVSGGAWAIWLIASRFGGRVAGRWASLLYLLWYASLDHHQTAQPDGWAAVLAAIGVAVMVMRTDRPDVLAAGIAGALIGTCALIKPTYTLLLALPLADGIAYRSIRPRVRIVKVWAASLAGFAVPVVACVGWLVARGALGAWRDVHLVWIPTSYTALDAAWFNRLQTLVSFVTTERFAPAVALAAAGLVFVLRSTPSRDAGVLGAWPVMAALGVVAQGQFFPYHWHPLYPPLAMLAGVAIGRVLTDAADGWRHADEAPARAEPIAAGTAVALAVAGIAVAGAFLEPSLHVYRSARFALGVTDGRELDRVEFGPFGHHAGAFPAVVAHLRSNSAPADRALVWGSAAGVNYLSGRASPSPFGFAQPLVDPPDSELRRRYRAEFIRDLTRTPPTYVVSLNELTCATNPTPEERKLMGRAEGLMRCLGDLPELRRYVLDHYDLERAIGPLELRRRR